MYEWHLCDGPERSSSRKAPAPLCSVIFTFGVCLCVFVFMRVCAGVLACIRAGHACARASACRRVGGQSIGRGLGCAYMRECVRCMLKLAGRPMRASGAMHGGPRGAQLRGHPRSQ